MVLSYNLYFFIFQLSSVWMVVCCLKASSIAKTIALCYVTSASFDLAEHSSLPEPVFLWLPQYLSSVPSWPSSSFHACFSASLPPSSPPTNARVSEWLCLCSFHLTLHGLLSFFSSPTAELHPLFWLPLLSVYLGS